jgi:hypothetical protein
VRIYSVVSRRFSVIWIALAGTAAGACALLVVARPQYDPYGWLLWGRELVHGSGFSTGNYPSWKPLAAVLAFPVALAGSAAPAVWLVVERALALVGVVFAYGLAARLGGRGAGALAAACTVLVTGWLGATLDGHLEPVLSTLLLAACWCHAQGRRDAAFGLLALAALGRPDAWLALGLYAVLLLRDRPRAWVFVVPVLAAIPVAWFGGDVLGSGSAFRGGDLARAADNGLATASQPLPGLYALKLGLEGALGVVALAAAVVFARGVRGRERLVITIGVCALSWICTEAISATAGYPADRRFAMPAAVLITVLGAAGLARGLRAAAARFGPRARVAAAVAVAAALAWSAVPALATMRSDARAAVVYSHNVASLARLTANLRAAGRLRCHPAVGQRYQAPLAWYAGREIAQVGHPFPDGIALAERTGVWPRLARLELNAYRYGGLAIERLRPRGIWQPLVLEPEAGWFDAGLGQRSRACDPTVAVVASRVVG